MGMTSYEDAEPDRRQCEHWIARKERCCTSTVTQAGHRFCSLHTPEALARARERSLEAAAREQSVDAANADSKGGRSTGAPRRNYRRLESQHLASRAAPGEPAPLQWEDSSCPVHLDIGSARGRWLLEIASERRTRAVNHVGCEIRGDLVAQANDAAREAGLSGRLAFAHADMAGATPSRRGVFARVAGQLACVSVMFPDPWPESCAREGKLEAKRTLTSSLAAEIASSVPAAPSTPNHTSFPTPRCPSPPPLRPHHGARPNGRSCRRAVSCS